MFEELEVVMCIALFGEQVTTLSKLIDMIDQSRSTLRSARIMILPSFAASPPLPLPLPLPNLLLLLQALRIPLSRRTPSFRKRPRSSPLRPSPYVYITDAVYIPSGRELGSQPRSNRDITNITASPSSPSSCPFPFPFLFPHPQTSPQPASSTPPPPFPAQSHTHQSSH